MSLNDFISKLNLYTKWYVLCLIRLTQVHAVRNRCFCCLLCFRITRIHFSSYQNVAKDLEMVEKGWKNRKLDSQKWSTFMYVQFGKKHNFCFFLCDITKKVYHDCEGVNKLFQGCPSFFAQISCKIILEFEYLKYIFVHVIWNLFFVGS